jgi:hypothetical protein
LNAFKKRPKRCWSEADTFVRHKRIGKRANLILSRFL